MSLIYRPRRLRRLAAIRDLVQETHLQPHNFVLPLFIKDSAKKTAIPSMPAHYQLTLNDLAEEIQSIVQLGVRSVILFGIPAKKDAVGSHAYSDNGIVQRAIREIKQQCADLLVISDICCCEYTDHGHCGIVDEQYCLDNDPTLNLLAKQSISHAKAGADIIAPSGMVDGMVGAIRSALDKHGFQNIPILSYAIKYASSFYGPFRHAAEGAPLFGDRKNYQMDPANVYEALKEAALDIEEGADMLMVKPGLLYLDIISRVKQLYPQMPLVAYQVSGEYAMLKAAAQQGWLEEKAAVLESLIALKRAGASIIISYYTKEILNWLR
jgi:porphobilinogen synthase